VRRHRSKARQKGRVFCLTGGCETLCREGWHSVVSRDGRGGGGLGPGWRGSLIQGLARSYGTVINFKVNQPNIPLRVPP